MQAWSLSDTGLVREQNQDYCDIVRFSDEQLLTIVCDGMGGARAGNVASRLACEVFAGEIRRTVHPDMSAAAIADMMIAGAELANRTVYEQSHLGTQFQGMGTTLVAAFLQGRDATVANIGDSRAYYMNRSGISRITVDHSVVEDMVRRGELTPDQARRHPRRNLITRAVGTEPDVLCDIFTKTLAAGDFLLLCTDGLSSVVTDQEMLFEVVHGANPDNCCRRLLAIAMAAGAPDNVTMALIRA